MDCIFCKIVNKEIPKEFVYEDDEVLAFDDIHPKAPTHILVIPREHLASIARAEDEHSGMLAKVLLTAKKIAEKKKLSGYKLVFNVGRDGGQVIDHVHLHVLGGWKGPVERSVNV